MLMGLSAQHRKPELKQFGTVVRYVVSTSSMPVLSACKAVEGATQVGERMDTNKAHKCCIVATLKHTVHTLCKGLQKILAIDFRSDIQTVKSAG